MSSDPEPMDALGYRHAERPVIKADPDTVIPAVSDGFELQRRVRCIALQLRKITMREGLNVRGQRIETLPEAL